MQSPSDVRNSVVTVVQLVSGQDVVIAKLSTKRKRIIIFPAITAANSILPCTVLPGPIAAQGQGIALGSATGNVDLNTDDHGQVVQLDWHANVNTANAFIAVLEIF